MAVRSLEGKSNLKKEYNHAQFESQRKILRFLLKYLGFTLVAKMGSVKGLENIPKYGPAIIMINHIAFIDPFAVINICPRNIVPMAKIEVFEYPIVGIFPKLWVVIPVRREEFDRQAVRMALDVLKAGEIILVAPEATRGPYLRKGKEGAAYLASRSGAPIIPVAIEGTEKFPAIRYSRPWSGTGAQVKFGAPFRFLPQYRRSDRDILRKMTEEAMYQLSAMLPASRRGVYSDLSNATQDTIEYV